MVYNCDEWVKLRCASVIQKRRGEPIEFLLLLLCADPCYEYLAKDEYGEMSESLLEKDEWKFVPSVKWYVWRRMVLMMLLHEIYKLWVCEPLSFGKLTNLKTVRTMLDTSRLAKTASTSWEINNL